MTKKNLFNKFGLKLFNKFNALVEEIKLIQFISLWELFKIRQSPRYTAGVAKTQVGYLDYVDPKTFREGIKEIFQNEIFLVKEFTNRSPVVVDCGANIGLASIYFATNYNAKVFAYEADPEIFKFLKRNIKNLSLQNKIKAFNKAIWIDDHGVEFEIEGGYSGQIKTAGETLFEKSTHVSSVSLRTIISKFDHIDFLKIDIEGAENKAVLECEGILNTINYIFIEYHSYAGEDQKLGEILNLLKNEGFRYHIKEAFTSEYPFKHVDRLLGKDLQLNIFAFRV